MNARHVLDELFDSVAVEDRVCAQSDAHDDTPDIDTRTTAREIIDEILGYDDELEYRPFGVVRMTPPKRRKATGRNVNPTNPVSKTGVVRPQGTTRLTPKRERTKPPTTPEHQPTA
jgi:hypothetical protein